MLLILFILGSLALLTTAIVDGVDDQSRFDQTKSRLEQIRRAVIGDTSRTLNGQPDVRGFVVDMGRLPANLRELISADGMQAWGISKIDIEDPGFSTVTIELYGGWRGPYLEMPPSFDGTPELRDGWNNVGGADDADNFGWDVPSPVSDNLIVRSLGADGAMGQSDPDNPYHEDFPSLSAVLVEENDFRIAIDKFTIRFSQMPAPGYPLHVLLYQRKDGLALTSIPESISFSTLSGVDTYDAKFPDDITEMGEYAAIVICNPSTPPPIKVFDGDCSGNTLHTRPFYFTLVPRSQLPVIRWNIQ